MDIWYKIGDAIELIKEVEGESVDFILTDPPYGIGELTGKKMVGDQNFDVLKKILPDLYRILKNNHSMMIFVGIGVLDKMFEIITRVFHYRWQFIWYQTNNMKRADMGYCKYCTALWFEKGRAKRVKPMQDLRKEPIPSKKIETIGHVTPKSVNICKYLIEGFTKEGELVFDPFLGSGTTLLAARLARRKAFGFEIEPRFEPIIKKKCMLNTPDIEFFDSQKKLE